MELPPQWFFVYFLFVVRALGVRAICECEVRFIMPVEAERAKTPSLFQFTADGRKIKSQSFHSVSYPYCLWEMTSYPTSSNLRIYFNNMLKEKSIE